jgi:hypothetical protein
VSNTLEAWKLVSNTPVKTSDCGVVLVMRGFFKTELHISFPFSLDLHSHQLLFAVHRCKGMTILCSVLRYLNIWTSVKSLLKIAFPSSRGREQQVEGQRGN